jgi:thioesterase domain-containing protein
MERAGEAAPGLKGVEAPTVAPLHRENAAARPFVSPRSSLESYVLQIWQRLIGCVDIGIDDDFFELGGDARLASQMVLEVEAITRQRMPHAVLDQVSTVRKLVSAVLRASPAPKELVTCVKEGKQTPFFFCHGDYATRGFYALKLADMLGPDQPVFLVHPHLDPDPRLTIEDMARAYLPHLLAAQPTGAFRLGGHCNGGLVAWEIACQLERSGREVEFVVVVDTTSLNARFDLRAIARLINLIVAVAPKRISEKFALDGMRAVRNKWKSTPTRFSRYGYATSNYVPSKIKTSVICVLCEESRGKTEYAPASWSRLAPEVQGTYIPGTHLGAITTDVGELARVLDGLLSERSNGSISQQSRK